MILGVTCVLMYFEVVSEVDINLNKFELVSFRNPENDVFLTNLLECKMVNLPIKYLGLPLGSKYKNLATWDLMIETFEKRLASWKRNFLFKCGRCTLIESTFANLPITTRLLSGY